MLLVKHMHRDLIIYRVCVHKVQEFVPCHGIHKLVNLEDGKDIHRVCLVEVYEIGTCLPFPHPEISYHDRVRQPVRVKRLTNETVYLKKIDIFLQCLLPSLSMAQRFCLTGYGAG